MDLRMFRYNGKHIRLGTKTYIMGILNVTPDSFSDGGHYVGADTATRHAAALVAGGADFIDIGAESTRPGYRAVEVDREWERLAPVLQTVRKNFPDVAISVDTQKAQIARRAIEYGADVINDVGGTIGDPLMLSTVGNSRAGYIMMYNREPVTQVAMSDVEEQFRRRIHEACAAGISADRILVDPGLGFAYGREENWSVLRQLERLQGLGAGILVGPSRKRFLGELTGVDPAQRDWATASIASLVVGVGMDVVRVHEVAGVRQALLVADRWWRNG